MRVSVIGCGHLGAPHAAGMAELGHEVVGVELDPEKVTGLNAGRAWFYEDDLDDLLAKHTASGRLRFTTDIRQAAAFADLHFIGVGTPTGPDGRAYDLSQVFGAVRSLAPHLDRDCLIVGKSTVTAGTTAQLRALVQKLAPAGSGVEVAWNPEFLREGLAVEDTLRPDRLVAGVTSARAEEMLREVYAPITATGVPLVITDPATAEIIKGSANAFLSVKISFINAVADLCEQVGADVNTVAATLGMDPRIGAGGMKPGIGYGGGCLPKDTKGFLARADELGTAELVELLEAAEQVNNTRAQRTAEKVRLAVGGDLEGKKVGFWGAAFKAGTDDIRQSPALTLAERLHAAGALVVVYDPQALGTAKTAHPNLGYAPSPEEAVEGADVLVIGTEWPQFAALDPIALRSLATTPTVVDGRNILDAERWRAAGWTVRQIGRP